MIVSDARKLKKKAREIITKGINGNPVDYDLERQLKKSLYSIPEISGISAPEIGFDSRLVYTKFKRFPFINPKIVVQSPDYNYYEETCLSCPGLAFRAERPDWITVEYHNYYINQKHFRVFKDYEARVMCHLIDHLDGILIADRNMEILLREINFHSISDFYEKKEFYLQEAENTNRVYPGKFNIGYLKANWNSDEKGYNEYLRSLE